MTPGPTSRSPIDVDAENYAALLLDVGRDAEAAEMEARAEAIRAKWAEGNQ